MSNQQLEDQDGHGECVIAEQTSAIRRDSRVLFAFTFLGGASYIMTRTVAISLFLAREGTASLPILLAVSAFAVIAISALAKKIAPLTSARSFAIGSCALLAAVSLLLMIAIIPFPHSAVALGALYVLAEVRGATNAVNTLSLSSEAFADSPTMRPYALIASGAPVAGIVVGVFVGFEAGILGSISLLAASIVADLVASFVISQMAPKPKRRPSLPTQVPSTGAVTNQSYKRHLSWLFILQVIVLTMITFQWEVSVGSYYGENEAELVAYFAFFYAATDFLAILIQWIGSGYLLDRFGMTFSLASFPILLAVVGGWSLFGDTTMALMAIFTVGKGLTVMRRAIHDPAMNAAYSLLRSGIRRDAILSIKGIHKPVAEAFTAGLLLALTDFLHPIYLLSIVWLTLVPFWIFFSIRTAQLHRSLTITNGVVSRAT